MEKMIQFENVSKQLGDFSIKNISFALPKGYIMGLIGANGAGKTSVLNLILGLYQPDAGEVKLFGCDYASEERNIRDQIGYVLADHDLFPENKKLLDNADLLGNYYRHYNKNALIEYCGEFSLDVNKKWKNLSKGERLKFQFAFALAHQPKLLVLDEPTANFDPQFKEQFLHRVTDFIRDGEHSVILVTHQLKELDQIADHITLLHQGRLLFSEEKESLMDRYRLVQGEDYKVELLNKERIVYKEVSEYAACALIRHRKIDTYDHALAVSVPAMEDIMYYFIKAQT
ncbi:MAG: ABC transporter ATP-binding protein [Eubacterium sp.]|nr:ABC transporter ATP-binding protein [Eubacterium sp.]